VARFILILAACAVTGLAWSAPAQAKENSSASEYRLPTYVWIDAYGDEPEEYAYWTVGRRYRSAWSAADLDQFEESGGCCPSVLRQVSAPGYASATFSFYDENDRLIRSVSKGVYVDENGLTHPEDFGTGYWRHNRWYWPRSYGRSDSDGQNMSLYDYPWPKLALSVETAGRDPWVATCLVTGNMPTKWFQSFEWDLNHDGVFNRTTGRSPSLSVEVSRPGRYIFAVRATDLRGYSTTAEYEFSVGR
jgi:hypothetical protein